jgi:LPS sulfotransferase NodH
MATTEITRSNTVESASVTPMKRKIHSTERDRIDADLARHPAVNSEDKTDYLLGRFHPHRFRMDGPIVEARVALHAMLSHDTPRPFLIYGRPRSGTTLLVQLLGQVPHMRCDGELLHYGLVSPLGLLRRLPRRAGPDIRAYGVKLLSYQLLEVQRVLHPLAFFDEVREMGYDILHVRRDTWSQTLSLVKAQTTGIYFNIGKVPEAVRIDPAQFVERLAWNARMLAYEDAVMEHVPHTRIQFEQDLRAADRHQATVDRICEMVSLDSAPVRARTERTGGRGGSMKLENEQELRDAVAARPDLAHLLR